MSGISPFSSQMHAIPTTPPTIVWYAALILLKSLEGFPMKAVYL